MSILEKLDPIYRYIPEIKAPEVKPPLKKKLMWSALALVIFFVMGNIRVVGISDAAINAFGGFQFILASKIGTLITVGIGPIVMASIILQLLVGGKIINLDLSDPAGRRRFSNLQKLLAIIMSFGEAMIYVSIQYLTPAPGMYLVVLLQIAFGAIILLYLDEIVSKYGIGSGIGLFIAGGVGGVVFWQVFMPPIMGTQGGLLLLIIGSLLSSDFIGALIYFIPIFFVFVIFFIVVFAEGMHVNIPITMGRHGMGGRFPVKFLYVSNLPVILAVALFLNLQMMAQLLQNVPVLGMIMGWVKYAITVPFSQQGSGSLIAALVEQGFTSIVITEIFHAMLYMAILIIFCIIFGKFWVEMAGQGSAAVSAQLEKSGMSIPGFRRDPRITRQILDRYIPPITILGSAFVGFLAGFADLTGALGTGTGILLTVGIVYRIYEELAREQFVEMHPMLGKLFG